MVDISEIRSRCQVVDGGCWEWQGPRLPRGYGKTKVDGKSLYVHRITYALTHGVDPGLLPSSWIVRHDCDNPRCCNPDHLRIGTTRDNYLDAVERGRLTPPRTHCPHGHAYDTANTYVDPRGKRHCRACERIRTFHRRPAAIRGRYRTRNNPEGAEIPGTWVPPGDTS